MPLALIETLPSPGVAVGVPPVHGAEGVAGWAFDSPLSPTAFVASTVKQYSVPLVRPFTLKVLPVRELDRTVGLPVHAPERKPGYCRSVYVSTAGSAFQLRLTRWLTTPVTGGSRTGT